MRPLEIHKYNNDIFLPSHKPKISDGLIHPYRCLNPNIKLSIMSIGTVSDNNNYKYANRITMRYRYGDQALSSLPQHHSVVSPAVPV